MSDKPAEETREPESPFLVERLMRQARLEMDEEGEYASEEDFRDAVVGTLDADLQERRVAALENNPTELAQELAYRSYEADDSDAALESAERALQLDPENCDALTVRAFLTCEDMGELIHQLEHAATCGENRLGEEFFAEFMGDFWPMVEARPYMRTIKQLAEVLWSVGRRLDAVAHYENLMDLDPDDHMGNAALLLGNYLAIGEIQRSWDLLEDNDDGGAVMSWAWVLLLVLTEDEEAARDSLIQAMEANPYVAPWLVGFGEPEVERSVDPWVAPGSEDEAHICVDILGEAWLRVPDAQWWLHDVLVDLGLLDAPEDEADPAPRAPVN